MSNTPVTIPWLLVASWDEDNKITSLNQTNIKSEAETLLSTIQKAGNSKAFIVQTEHAHADVAYITVDPVGKTVTFDEEGALANATAKQALTKIKQLEASLTPRRLRDALASDEGKTWVADVEKLIATERAKL